METSRFSRVAGIVERFTEVYTVSSTDDDEPRHSWEFVLRRENRTQLIFLLVY